MRGLFNASRGWKQHLLWTFAVSIVMLSATTAKGTAQSTTEFRVPLMYGYQADPMMVTYNGRYYLYVNDQMGYDRMRKSKSLAGIAGSQSELLYTGDGVTEDVEVTCGYIIQWQGSWYQYCGDTTGGLVLKSNTSDPTGGYTFFGRNLDVPPGYTAYAKWPILVNNHLYMLATINGDGQVPNSIWAATYSDPVTRTGSWNQIAVPTKGTGSWECADNRCIDEGGSTVVHGSNVFLLFSAGGYEDPGYCVGMLTAAVTSDLSQQSS